MAASNSCDREGPNVSTFCKSIFNPTPDLPRSLQNHPSPHYLPPTQTFHPVTRFQLIKGFGGDDKNMLGLQKQATWKGTSVIRESTSVWRKLLSIFIRTAGFRGRAWLPQMPMAEPPEGSPEECWCFLLGKHGTKLLTAQRSWFPLIFSCWKTEHVKKTFMIL